MNRKGFTLVELMTVVVIIGLLAAVAIPKLGIVVIKSKASEVVPAAGSYIKLQKAYLFEREAVGTWRRIGYHAPGRGQTNNFTYSKGDISGLVVRSDLLTTLGGNGKVGWQAENRNGLGDCSNGKWQVAIVAVDELTVNYVQKMGSSKSTECAALTSNWGGIDVGTLRSDEEIAASESRKNYGFGSSLYQPKYDENGVLTLARAILSGKSTSNMTNVYEHAGASVVQTSFSEQYGIQGYVLNDEADTYISGSKAGQTTELKTWLQTQVKSTAYTNQMKIMTALDTDDETLTKGKVYRGTQSLYYGTEQDGLDRIDLYGTRDVYAVYDGSKVTYYSDAALTQVIDLATDTNWKKYVNTVNDPMKQEWTTAEELLENQVAVNGLGNAILSNEGSETSGFNEAYGIDGYVITASGDGLATYLQSAGVSSSRTSKIKVVTEVHSNYENKLSIGSVYAATQVLYYGNDYLISAYGTRNVYALVTGSGDNYNVRYFSDLECTEEIQIASSEGWKKNVNTVNDPMTAEWTTSEALTKTASGSLGSAILSNGGSKNSGFNESNDIAGYVLIDGASGQKDFLTEVGVTRTSNIKLVTEIHSDYKAGLTTGSVYAATQILYYGDANYVSAYGTRDVYALVTGTGVKYFTDLECTEEVTASTTAGWNELPKDETPTTQWCSNDYSSPLLKDELTKTADAGNNAKLTLPQAIVSNVSSTNTGNIQKYVGLAEDGKTKVYEPSTLYNLYGIEGFMLNISVKSEKINNVSQESRVLTWLKSESGVVTDYVQMVTEVHTQDAQLTAGTKYVADVTLYSGKADKVTAYGKKEVCAVAKDAKSVTYYEKSVCSSTGDPDASKMVTVTDSNFWKASD